MKKIPLIIDTDPGIDDTMALIMLSQNLKNYDVKLLTSVCGNTPINYVTQNLQFIAEHYFKQAKVARGVSKPLKKQFESAQDVHGKTGMGSIKVGKSNYPILDDAILAMKNVIFESEEKITLITLGPLTNIATLFQRFPETKEKISVIYSMVGSIDGTGNIRPYAEFNAFVDPDALKIVVESGIKIIFNTIEIGNAIKVHRSKFESITPKNETQRIIRQIGLDIVEVKFPGYICFYDSSTIMSLIKPELFNFIPCDVEVNTTDELRGKVVMTKNPKGKHCYLEIKNLDNSINYVMDELFNKN